MLHHLHKLSLIAAFTGFTANIAQVALFRFFMGQFYGTEIHLGLFLSIWLLGIAIGGFIGGKISISPRLLLAALFVLPLMSVGTLYYGVDMVPAPEGGFLPFAPVALFMLAAVTPVSLLIGTLIPCLIRLSHKSLGYFYSLEAIGGFAGGVFFSLLLGGTADSVLCLLALPLLPIAAETLISRKKLLPALLTLTLAPLVWHFGPAVSHRIENSWWQRMQGLLTLEQTVETPYQKLQIAGYHEQKSLFSNGMFSDSWPNLESSEARVHTFATVLSETGNVLLIGAPSAEIVREFLKYPNLKLTVVEPDGRLFDLLGYDSQLRQAVKITITDPRQYLNHANKVFDGIMICPISPVTLVGNRLFTVEAFKAMHGRLKPTGILCLQVEGSENYLGNVKEKIMLSAWQALKAQFAHCAAFPGSNITFFASPAPVTTDARALAARFSGRGVQTTTFMPMSFHNLLMPFRVKELEQWLAKDVKVDLNTDARPGTFMQQLELWNIYSGTSLNRMLHVLQHTSRTHLFAICTGFGLFLMLLPLVASPVLASRSIIAAGVAASGATGLLSEIILILLYQNRHGAAYQMTALFFGLYMLGLATGSMTFGRLQHRPEAIRRLKHVKLLQIVFTGLGILFVERYNLHSAAVVGAMVFLIAFLDGIEFPVADSILRGSGRQAHDSAGLLLFSDSAGAMLVGTLSGLWLLPAFGMQNCFALLCLILSLNFAALLLYSRKIHEG